METKEQSRDLFGDVDDIVQLVAPSPVGQDSTGYTSYWHQYRKAIQQAHLAIGDILSGAKTAFGRDYAVGENFSDYSMLRSTRQAIESALVAKAEREFAPPGGTLRIDSYSVKALLPSGWNDASDDDFDPDALWHVLEQQHGGDAGIKLAHKQNATTLVQSFCLSRNPPARKANRIELVDSIYCEERFRGGMEISYSSRESVLSLHRAIAAFCTWAGDTGSAERVNRRASEMSRDSQITSRQRFDMGGVGYVTYYKSMTWEIYGELADSFQVYITTYGRDALER